LGREFQRAHKKVKNRTREPYWQRETSPEEQHEDMLVVFGWERNHLLTMELRDNEGEEKGSQSRKINNSKLIT
jgi:hypothetical protein